MAERGRPTKYKEEYNDQAYKLCLLGHTDAELGEFFEVDERTINNWKIDFPCFFQSIKKGKAVADGNVAASLYHRAIGYQAPDLDIKMHEGKIIETPYTKHYPPDATSAIFWLKNRQPKAWRDKQDLDVTTKGESLNKTKFDASKLTDEQLRNLDSALSQASEAGAIEKKSD